MPTNTKLSEERTATYEPAMPDEYRSPQPEYETPPHRSKTSRKRGVVWLILLMVVGGLSGYAVWRAGQPATTPQRSQGGGGAPGGGGRGGRGGGLGPVPVVVTRVGRSSIPVYLNGLGNVTPYFTVTVKSRVDGQLMKVDFNEGDLVQQGQTLIEIDQRPYQVQLDQYEGQLIRDQAILDNARVDLARYQPEISVRDLRDCVNGGVGQSLR